MSKTENQDLFLRNNTGSKSKSTIIDGFVIRTSEFDHINNQFSNCTEPEKLQNTIIIGQRGAGKTTLMHRLNYSILDSGKLSQKYLPVLFSEEQYNLSDLTNLWEAAAVFIEDNFHIENLTSKIDEIIENEKEFEKKSFEFLEQFLISQKKTAVLFIENINYFLKKLSENEKKRLKSILTSNSPIRIVGSSTSYSDGSTDFQDKFYNFFQIVALDGLTQEECIKLLIKIGQQYGEEEQIINIINNYPGRVESLRRLTGGVPRTISYLFQIFLDNENGKAIKDLYLLIDTLTLLYKSELDQLSTQQQKVIDIIARRWDAISVKEIAKKTRLESKNISSILSYLEKNQLLERIQTPTKNHLYRIKERFMNIWYLMRFGRKNDKENVIWLVRFFDAWCDESELTKRLEKYISNVKGGKYDPTAAIDMGNTFLSCENLPEALKEELIHTTNSVLPERLLKNSKTSSEETLKEIKNLIEEENYSLAVEKLQEVEDKNIDFYTLATSVYLHQGNVEKALDAAKSALTLDEKTPLAYLSMGIIYDFYLNDSDVAIDYYKKCLELQEHPYAANLLGNIYSNRNDFETAINYHNQAISKTFKQPLLSLAMIHVKLKDFDKAEEYFKEAIKARVDRSSLAFSRFLVQSKRNKEALQVLQKAVQAKEERSNINLGRFYLSQKRQNIKKAEEQFFLAVQNGEVEGYEQLGSLYSKSNELEKAREIYMEGVKQGSAESAHRLAHILNRSDEFEKSDEMFAKAIELGERSVMGCWIQSMYNKKRNDKRKYALQLLEDHFKNVSPGLRFKLLHAKILLWNDKLPEALQIIKENIQNVINSFNDDEGDDKYADTVLGELVDFFILLIAKKQQKTALELFNDSEHFDLKTILKPVYFVLMEDLKKEFPLEYLKAGKELSETINDLKKEVAYLRRK